MRSGRGFTADRGLADKIFTTRKRALHIPDIVHYKLFFSDLCDSNPHWFGKPQNIWKLPPNHDDDLIFWTRSENCG